VGQRTHGVENRGRNDAQGARREGLASQASVTAIQSETGVVPSGTQTESSNVPHSANDWRTRESS
jgi:hypothetical protein